MKSFNTEKPVRAIWRIKASNMEKKILIVGGSSGGLALVKLLCQENNVIVASRTNDSISDLPITYHPFDVEKDDLDTSKIPDQPNGLSIVHEVLTSDHLRD